MTGPEVGDLFLREERGRSGLRFTPNGQSCVSPS